MGKFESIGTIQPFLKLHEGEWADVFKAYDASASRNVLLKKLKSIFEHDAEVAERFEAEARLMAKIRHPNVVSILTSGRAGSSVYFTAEFVEGLSLADLLDHGALPPLLAVFVLREVAQGLTAAHAQHIFHRDIKPKNVLVSDAGEVKLTDFGMASILEGNEDKELRGTMGYIAPELLFDGKPGQASDIFSLGVTFYEMLTGTTAFRGESSREVFDHTLNYDPIPLLESNPKIAPGLIDICRTALEKDPQHRYTICEDVIADLNAMLKIANDFGGKEEIVRYITNPDQYESYPGEQALFNAARNITLPKTASPNTTWPNQDANQTISPVKQRTSPGLKWIVAGCVMMILSLAIVWGATNRPQNEPVIQEVNQISASPDSVGSEVPLPDSLLSTPTVSPETRQTQTALSAPMIDSADTRVVTAEEPEEPQMAQISSDTMPPVDVPPDQIESPSTGEFDVLCTPFCTVYINNDSMGIAPPGLPMVLPPGTHRLDLTHPVLPTYSTDITIEAGRKDSIRIALRDYIGTIELNVTPWAKVYIDDVFQGDVPPIQSYTFKPGEYILRLEHDLGTWTDTVLVVARERRTYKYNLSDLLQ